MLLAPHFLLCRTAVEYRLTRIRLLQGEPRRRGVEGREGRGNWPESQTRAVSCASRGKESHYDCGVFEIWTLLGDNAWSVRCIDHNIASYLYAQRYRKKTVFSLNDRTVQFKERVWPGEVRLLRIVAVVSGMTSDILIRRSGRRSSALFLSSYMVSYFPFLGYSHLESFKQDWIIHLGYSVQG